MSRRSHFYSILSIILFIACNSIDPQQALLNHADSLMQVQPDSALAFLEDMDLSGVKSPADQARYAVLLTQAKDKNYIRHTDDSVIRSAVEYYDSTGDVPMQAKAHYYWGRVCQDKKDKAGAAREYWETVSFAEKADDLEILSLALGNLGLTYTAEGLFEKADSLYARAEAIAMIRKDSVRLVTFLTMRGCINADKESETMELKIANSIKAKHYFDQALYLAEKTDNRKQVNTILIYLNTFLKKEEKEETSIELLRDKMCSWEDTTRSYGYYLTLGSAFYRSEHYDSAAYYCIKSLPSTSYFIKAGATNQLAKIALHKGELKRALYWKDLHTNYADTAMRSEHSVDMIVAEYNHRIRRNDEVHSGDMRTGWIVLSIAAFIIVLLFLSWRYRVRLYRKEKKDKLALTEEKQQMLLLHEDMTVRLVEKEGAIAEKDQLLQAKVEEGDRLEEILKDYEKDKINSLVLQNKMDSLYKDRQELFLNQFSKLPIYQTFLDYIDNYIEGQSELLQKEAWKEFSEELDRTSVGFTERLLHKYPMLNSEDIIFCCVLKANFNYVEASKLFSRSTHAMYKRRNSILDKVKVGADVKEVTIEDLILRV